MTVADRNVSLISLQIIDAMRNHFAFGEVLVIMIVDFNGLLRITPTSPIQLAQAFFFLAVYTPIVRSVLVSFERRR